MAESHTIALTLAKDLARLLRAGESAVSILNRLSGHSRYNRLEPTLTDVVRQAMESSSLAAAFALHSDKFPEPFIDAIRRGEAKGALYESLMEFVKAFEAESKR